MGKEREDKMKDELRENSTPEEELLKRYNLFREFNEVYRIAVESLNREEARCPYYQESELYGGELRCTKVECPTNKE